MLRLFMWMGVVAFGGPVAHIALLEQEVVTRRNWVDSKHFMDLLAITHLVPGPNSTQMVMHVGYLRGGDLGTWVAGLAFILPAYLITLILSTLYIRYEALPVTHAFFYGIQPVIVAMILVALYRLSRKEIQSLEAGVILCVALALVLVGVDELLIMALAGIWGMRSSIGSRFSGWMMGAVSWGVGASLGASEEPSVSLPALAGQFLKFGATLYGSGYLLIAFIQSDLVQRLGWLTQAELLDAIAIGQMTPGPILTTATAVGYLVAGLGGSIVATAAMFLPSFILVMLVGRWMDVLRRSEVARQILAGITPAVLAVMLHAAAILGRGALVDPFTISVCLLALFFMGRRGVDALRMIGAGAVLGVIILWWGG